MPVRPKSHFRFYRPKSKPRFRFCSNLLLSTNILQSENVSIGFFNYFLSLDFLRGLGPAGAVFHRPKLLSLSFSRRLIGLLVFIAVKYYSKTITLPFSSRPFQSSISFAYFSSRIAFCTSVKVIMWSVELVFSKFTRPISLAQFSRPPSSNR